jgi:putative hydrolase of the HAD superfamily
MLNSGLVIFDAFNTIITSHQDSKQTFLAGLIEVGLPVSPETLAKLQTASEGLDHSEWSCSRRTYTAWAAATLSSVARAGTVMGADLAPQVIPALEQLHQAPMVAMPGAADCLAAVRRAGFTVALCSNWGWDLAVDVAGAGLAGHIDVFVTSAQAGYRKPHPRIYQATLERAGFGADDAVFIGDSLRTDVLGPQRAGIRSVLLASDTKRQLHREQVTSLAAVTHLILRDLARSPPGDRDATGRLTTLARHDGS